MCILMLLRYSTYQPEDQWFLNFPTLGSVIAIDIYWQGLKKCKFPGKLIEICHGLQVNTLASSNVHVFSCQNHQIARGFV